MAEEIIEEVYTGDPVPVGPKLKEEHRAKLDSIVQKMTANKESDGDIRAVVNDFKQKYMAQQPAQAPAPQPAFQVQISEPTFKSAPAQTVVREFTDKKPVDELATEKLRGKAAQAQQEIHKGLEGNRDIKESMIRQRRFDEASANIPAPKSDIARTRSEMDVARLIEPAVKPQDLPVTQSDLRKEDMDIASDRGKAVRLIEEMHKVRPDKAKEIQRNVYILDAYNSLASTPEVANERVGKIENNLKQLEKGNLVYDVRTNTLIKPVGIVGSAIEGWKQKSKLFADYDFLKTTENDAAIAMELEDRRTHADPDEPVAVPKGKLSEISSMLGGTPIKPLLGGLIAGALTTPMGGGTAGAVIGGREFAKLEYASNFQQVYNELRDQGVEEFEAVRQARRQAENAAELGAISGGAMGAIGARIGARPLALSNTLKRSVFNVLKATGNELGRAGLEGLASGGVGAAAQLYKNKLAQNAGIKRDISEGVVEQIESNLVSTVAMAAAIKAGRGITKSNYRNLMHGLSKLPESEITGMLQEKVNSGEITQKAADETRQRINEYKDRDAQIPPNVTEEARFKIQDNIEKIDELEKQKEATHKSLQEPLKEKIQKLTEDNLTLSKEVDKVDKLESGLTGKQEKEAVEFAEELLAEGVVEDVYEGAIKKDPIGFWRDISQQAQNRDADWKPLKAEDAALSEQAVRDQFGDTVVDYAKELFPAPEATPSSVSVIMPEDIKHPETITISPREQPADIQSTENVSVVMPKGAEAESLAVNPGEENVAPIEGVKEEGVTVSSEGAGEPRKVGITHRQMDDIAREFGFDTYDKSPERIAEWDEQAVKKMADNPNALPELFLKLRNGQSPDPVETRMMVQYMGDLMAKIDMNPANPELLTQLKRTKDLFNIAGRIQGQQLVARKGSVGAEDRLGDFLVKDMEANRAPLTEEQTAKSIEEFNEIKKTKDEFEAKVAKLESENAKLKAQKEVEKIAKADKKVGKRDFKAERDQVLRDMKKKWDDSKGQLSATFIPYADRLVKIAPDAARLIKLLVEEGIEKLPDLVKAAHDHLKLFIPEITENDVHDLIAGEYRKPKETKTDLAEKLYDLRTEAKLINRLEALESGEEPKSERQKIKRSREVEELRNQIKEHDLTKLSARKKRIQGDIDKVQEQLRTGQYSEPKKPEIKLDDEAVALQDELIKLKQEREKRLAKLEYENRTNIQQVKDVATNILNVPRTLMASADLSAPLRQGIIATVAHPKLAAKAFPEMIRQAFSKKEFDRWLVALKESPAYKLMESAGLYIADPNSLHLQAKEEQFMSNLGEKIPVVGKIVKGSERGYVAYLNKMRADLFQQGVDLFESQGRTFENSPELYKGLARFINNATGRGGLGPLEQSAQVLNTAFFSPRLIASRLNMINPVFYTKLPKEVRIMALKDMGKMILFGASVLGLAKAAGADVEIDPRSSDFGKIKVGNTRWDIWGGFQQYARIFAQLLTGETKSSNTGQIYELKGDKFPYKTRLDQLGSFFRGKLAPVPGTAIDLLAGKNVIGEEIEPAKKAYELFVPMILQDIQEAWKEQGPKSILTVGVPSALGVGTTTYEQEPSKSKSKSGLHKTPRGKSKKNIHKKIH